MQAQRRPLMTSFLMYRSFILLFYFYVVDSTKVCLRLYKNGPHGKRKMELQVTSYKLVFGINRHDVSRM